MPVNTAFREMVFEIRETWEKRPLVYTQDLSTWDDDRLFDEMCAQVEGMTGFLASEIVSVGGARAVLANLSSLRCEMSKRRRKG